ncbi:MAG: hypothetical protein PHC88_07465 [Terrimicrobiaceae bacterium]|nr:hypothetical protein [Terrimicrobiaceae bacterium]
MSAPPEAPAHPPSPPRYRYFTVPPAAVRLTVDDLTALLPEGAWNGTDEDKRRELALPSAEILEANFPRIRFSRLRNLLPGCIRSIDGAPEWVALPTDRVAIAYRPETRRELISEPEKEAGPVAEAKSNEVAVETKSTAEPVAKTEPPPEPVALSALRIPAKLQSRLQRIYMTEDEVTASRLIELAGGLPGLQGCALVRGAETVCSSGFPAGLDAPSLAANARELLDGLGKSSGLEFQPTITLYAESGPVSLLHKGGFRILVFHRERGFLPGVRETLATTLELLARD